MVYFCKSVECFSNCQGQKMYFEIVFCIWMTSFVIHICTLKQHTMSTCSQNKHPQRHLVEDENAVSNWEKLMEPSVDLAVFENMIEVST